MNLDAIRAEIDGVDKELAKLFEKRMGLCTQVAEYKKANNLPVFQPEREKQILEKVRKNASEGFADAQALFFDDVMNISKCIQTEKLTELDENDFGTPCESPEIACPGIKGSYTESACKKAFPNLRKINYVHNFEDVFEAVDKGDADYGIVPLENSTAGDVTLTYDLMGRYDFYIVKRVYIEVSHVLASKNASTKDEIESVISHEQALHQCAEYLRELNKPSSPVVNTSVAAKAVSESDEKLACICSADCAELYGLKILERGIADNGENFTRFIVISKKRELPEKADVISIMLTLPHTAGSLFRLLTRFAYVGLNLTKIESKPLPLSHNELREERFDVVFYFDFEGNIRNERIQKLLKSLEAEMKLYKFLGNYEEML